jgi:hypothetical protein
MKIKLIIVSSILVYTAIIAYIFLNIGSFILVKTGGTYQVSRKTADGYQCLIRYLDKNSKTNPKIQLMSGFEKKVSSSCPDTDKTVEVTKEEAVKIVQDALNSDYYQLNPPVIVNGI